MDVTSAATKQPSRERAVKQVELRLPRRAETVGDVRRVLDAVLAALDVGRVRRQRIALAVDEACANAVVHAAGAEEYDVVVRVTGGCCQVYVLDRGCGFDHSSALLVPPPASAEAGRGLHLIAALTDQFEVHTRPGRGTLVWLSIDLGEFSAG